MSGNAPFAAPYQAPQAPYQTQYPSTGSYYQGPTGQYPIAPATQPGGSGRGGRVALIAVGAILLALASGTIGGLVVHQADGGAHPVSVITRAAAPEIQRSSVAGVAQAMLPSVVDITTGQGEGSGVILSSDGSIVTNNHVVEGASGNQVTVTFSDGKTAKATIVGTDPVGDIAVIKAQGVSGLTAAQFGDSDSAQVGDTVLAIGSPLGLQGSVSEGIISALHRTINEGADPTTGSTAHSISDALQTDAAINPGNSGGALVNLAGKVIGINTAIATSGGSASGNIGVGFAISSNKVKAAADLLVKGGKVSHPYLGVRLTDGNGGALIADVVVAGPADKGGLKKGDVVTKADSQTVSDGNGLINAVQAHKAGDALQLTVQRNGSPQQVTVTLGETP
jgi:putative serine protease PepD